MPIDPNGPHDGEWLVLLREGSGVFSGRGALLKLCTGRGKPSAVETFLMQFY